MRPYMVIGACSTAGSVLLALIALVQARQSAHWPAHEKCYELLLSLTEKGEPKAEVTLNTDGSWTIPSWEAVSRMATQSWDAGMQCIARELLKHRQQIVVDNYNQAHCPLNWPRPLKNTPIVHKCQWMFDWRREWKETSRQFPATRAAREG